jgi:dTDP-4-dehydrorhamnose 3,5-epimerase
VKKGLRMALRTLKHPKHVTKNRFGKPNGYLIPIVNIHDGFIPQENFPKQIYLTVCDIGEVKGPHLHMKRCGLFTCIQGDVRVIAKTKSGYEEYYSGENFEFATIEVPAGIPSAVQNIGEVPAYILNMPSPAWHVDDQDDHPVTFDDYDFSIMKKK